MPESGILPGAEPFSAEGGPHGALVLHGFTGCPQSMRGLARAFATAGFAVELPRLPGHGTSVEDMSTTGWADWTAAVESARRSLAGRCERMVVAGLSMGGALTLWLAARHPEISGIVVINAVGGPPDPDPSAALRAQLEQGVQTIPGVGNDVADPETRELAYELVPIRSLLSMFEGLGEVAAGLAAIRCPTLIMTSPRDHVVQPVQSDLIAAGVAGPVERITLERSYHVATLDYDRDVIEREAVAFARRVTAEPGQSSGSRDRARSGSA
jgi:carboxylesterase